MDDNLANALKALGGTIMFWSIVIAYQLNGIKNAIREHNNLREENQRLQKKKLGQSSKVEGQ